MNAGAREMSGGVTEMGNPDRHRDQTGSLGRRTGGQYRETQDRKVGGADQGPEEPGERDVV